MRQPSPLALAVCALAALVLRAADARAIDVNDAPSGFHIAMNPPGFDVCAAYPVSIRNAESCPGLTLPAASAFDAVGQRQGAGIAHMPGVVYFVKPDWQFFAIVVATSVPNNNVMSASDIREHLAEMHRGIFASSPPGTILSSGQEAEHYEQLTVHGVQVVRNVLSRTLPAGDTTHHNRVLLYEIVGRDWIISLSFWCDATQLDVVRAQADAMVQTVTMPPAQTVTAKITHALGILAGCAGVPLALIVAVIVVVSRRRARAIAPLPWNGPQGPYGTPGAPVQWQQPGTGWPQGGSGFSPPPQPPPPGGWPPPR